MTGAFGTNIRAYIIIMAYGVWGRFSLLRQQMRKLGTNAIGDKPVRARQEPDGMRLKRRDNLLSGSGTNIRESVQCHNRRSGHSRGGEASSPDITWRSLPLVVLPDRREETQTTLSGRSEAEAYLAAGRLS